jgi:methyl-accepting chemotaxis protein
MNAHCRPVAPTRWKAALHGQGLAVGGAATVALIVVFGFALLIRGIQRPLAVMLRAMTDMGNGQRSVRITSAMGSQEFTDLAEQYNVMANQLEDAVADQIASEAQLHVANTELQRNSETPRQRGDVIELLGGMAHRMQAARTDDDWRKSSASAARLARHVGGALCPQQFAQSVGADRRLGRNGSGR